MPLRDHFREPLSKRRLYSEIHGAWAAVITFRLNDILPAQYYCGPNIQLGSAMEIDVGTWENGNSVGAIDGVNGSTAPAWSPAASTLLLDTDDWKPPEYEVLVYDESDARRLVAAIELVSPANKDRPQSREKFVSKCQTLLQQDVCVVIVDPVTDHFFNLYAELAERIGAEQPTNFETPIYAVSCRSFRRGGRTQVHAWKHELAIGSPLPTLPLWLTDTFSVSLELERTYEETCRGLRIA